MAKKPGIKLIANNKKAFHDYFIEDTYEAGIAGRNRSKTLLYGKMQRQGIILCGFRMGRFISME